jgi:hypothetical protein
LVAHVLAAPVWPRVREDSGEVELSVLGIHVLHEVELARRSSAQALLEALDDFR